MLYTTPNDYDRPSDSGRIQKAIIEAKKSGCNQVVIPRRNEAAGSDIWIIEETILLPSDITVILDNCHLRMADGVMCQMFCNENAHSPIGATKEGMQKNIRLIGRGNAILDGGNDNGLCEKTSNKDGMPHVMQNLTVFFRNVQNFTISNLTVREQRWWAICFLYSAFGKVSDIHFEILNRYERGIDVETGYWRNQDGIDLRVGCHDITLENITGETGDDVIACTALAGPNSFEDKLRVEGARKDIYNISIRNVKATCNLCAIIRLLTHNRNKIYNVSIDGVHTLEDTGVLPAVAIRLNEHHYYAGKNPENKAVMGEMHSVSIRNIYAEAKQCGILFNGDLCDIAVRDVFMKNDVPAVHSLSAFDEEVFNTLKNSLIEGIHAKHIKQFEHMTEENVVIRDCFEK